MSEKITNTFTFFGNEKIKGLEREMINRFQQDRVQGNDEMSAIKRILFGLGQDVEFNAFEKLGADWAYFFDTAEGFELESKECALHALQNFITSCAAKLDPDVVIKMDYVGNTPKLIGTRITCVNSEGKVLAVKSDQTLECWFCDEDDLIDTTEQLESEGYRNPVVMSYQDLNQFIENHEEFAITDFNAVSGKSPISVD